MFEYNNNYGKLNIYLKLYSVPHYVHHTKIMRYNQTQKKKTKTKIEKTQIGKPFFLNRYSTQFETDQNFKKITI